MPMHDEMRWLCSVDSTYWCFQSRHACVRCSTPQGCCTSGSMDFLRSTPTSSSRAGSLRALRELEVRHRYDHRYACADAHSEARHRHRVLAWRDRSAASASAAPWRSRPLRPSFTPSRCRHSHIGASRQAVRSRTSRFATPCCATTSPGRIVRAEAPGPIHCPVRMSVPQGRCARKGCSSTRCSYVCSACKRPMCIDRFALLHNVSGV